MQKWSTPEFFFHILDGTLYGPLHNKAGIDIYKSAIEEAVKQGGKIECGGKVIFNPFPNKPWFLRVCSTSLLKTLWEKEKLLVTSNFSFSHIVFYPFG